MKAGGIFRGWLAVAAAAKASIYTPLTPFLLLFSSWTMTKSELTHAPHGQEGQKAIKK